MERSGTRGGDSLSTSSRPEGPADGLANRARTAVSRRARSRYETCHQGRNGPGRTNMCHPRVSRDQPARAAALPSPRRQPRDRLRRQPKPRQGAALRCSKRSCWSPTCFPDDVESPVSDPDLDAFCHPQGAWREAIARSPRLTPWGYRTCRPKGLALRHGRGTRPAIEGGQAPPIRGAKCRTSLDLALGSWTVPARPWMPPACQAPRANKLAHAMPTLAWPCTKLILPRRNRA